MMARLLLSIVRGGWLARGEAVRRTMWVVAGLISMLLVLLAFVLGVWVS
jgi:hypothetical protein